MKSFPCQANQYGLLDVDFALQTKHSRTGTREVRFQSCGHEYEEKCYVVPRQ